MPSITGPGSAQAVDHPELENDPRFATYEERFKNAAELVSILDGIFRSRTYGEWIGILSQTKIVWSPVTSPLEVTRDQQAVGQRILRGLGSSGVRPDQGVEQSDKIIENQGGNHDAGAQARGTHGRDIEGVGICRK